MAIEALAQVPIEDDPIADAVGAAVPADRRRILKVIRRRRDAPLCDGVFAALPTRHSEADAAALPAGCSDGIVGRHLPSLDHAITSWATLARSHPERLLDFLNKR